MENKPNAGAHPGSGNTSLAGVATTSVNPGYSSLGRKDGGHQNAATASAPQVAQAETVKKKPQKVESGKSKKATNVGKKSPAQMNSSTMVLKYLKIRVRNLFHVPLSILNKSACILPDDTLIDVLPVAWELLRETDRDVVGAAAAIFIVSSVKVPTHTTALINSEMNHQLPDQRINAIFRFQTLWRNRHQIWQRLEENGQLAMKVTPSQIEFTLPSPKLGVESSPVIDAPWDPKVKTKITKSTHGERGQMLLSATTSRKKQVRSCMRTHSKCAHLIQNQNVFSLQQSDMVKSVIQAEEEKRRKERINFHVTSVPLLQKAAYEPSLYHGATEDHDERE